MTETEKLLRETTRHETFMVQVLANFVEDTDNFEAFREYLRDYNLLAE